ncbi:MAG: hypothetical protein QOI11_824 [Candidatus Eremiobacteraeota bacterium]|nr:hypothetical protein [Candidatus Eremiobacteraeota bacterium]
MAHQHKRTLKPSSAAPRSGEFVVPGSSKRTTVVSSKSQIIERYVVGDPRRVEQLRADRQWFSDHQAELAQQLPNRFLAIVGQRVVDSDSNREALARRVYERSEPAIFMPYTGEETDTGAAKQPSPRIER